MRHLRALMLALLMLVVALGASAKGPSKADLAEAVKADKQGQKLEKKKDFEQARDAYNKSLELNDSPDVRLRLAGVEEKLGHLVEAQEQLKKVLEADKVKFPTRAKAQAKLKGIEKRIPTLQLDLPKDFKGTVKVDDEEVGAGTLASPIPLNPGSHNVRAEADGYKTFSESVELAEKEKKTLSVLMTEDAPPPVEPVDEEPQKPEKDKGDKGSGARTLGWVAIGVGVVGVVVGTYYGLKARSTKSELDDACKDNVCSDAQRSKYDDGKKQANISTLGFIVGAVGIGVGTVLLISSGGEKKEAARAKQRRITPYLGPGSAGVVGTF